MSKRLQPPREAFLPRENVPVLKLYNSLTRQKEIFEPQSDETNDRKVTWYSCGPTVYDSSHMGHARSYITFDILRRVLQDYFGYDIDFVMNITDIDDKIIKRARQNYLFEKYVDEKRTLEQTLEDAKEVLTKFENTASLTKDQDKKDMLLKLLNKLTESVNHLKEVFRKGDEELIEAAQCNLISEGKDLFSEWLDAKQGASITDNAIFSILPRRFEEEFLKDMDSLNVLRPHFLTRVSEYIPEIVVYIEKIISNGFAYEANGSVYFDVATFDRNDKHFYAKLVPEAYGDTNSLQEGEGDLTTIDQQNEKRSPTDFALWKRSKKGEPAWDSPWGRGRPGWHIECSAMASAICGPILDIHTGGVDLKFPHHDNEIAQSEAYFESKEWVKYFLHSGHLTIKGCKMSKSLKNFVTIQQALEKYSARQLRFAFLLHSWRDTLDYSQNTMECAIQFEKLFNEFFLTVKDLTRDTQAVNKLSKVGKLELDLKLELSKANKQVHSSLCDNIDTKSALEALRALVTASNLYLRSNKEPYLNLLIEIVAYVSRILTVFGIDVQTVVGIKSSQSSGENNEEAIMPYLSIIAEFRENVRNQSKSLGSDANEILRECDRLRDDVLPNVGVRLEDKDGGRSAIKFVGKEVLLKEREAKKLADLEKAAEKERKRALMAAQEAEREAQKRIPPSEMFRKQTDKYSKFDENGLPTHDSDGKDLSKGSIKKLIKLQQAQEKKYQDYLASHS